MSLLRVRGRSLSAGLLASGLIVGTLGVVAPVPASAATALITNGSTESVSRRIPTGWTKAGFGSNARVLISAAGGAQSGRRFVRTRVTRYTSGAAWWYTPAAVVKAGGSYTFSEYYRSGSRTTVNAYFTVGSRVVGRRLAVVPASSTWKGVRVTVKAPAGATRVRFGHALTSVGYVDVDNIGLAVAAATASTAPTTPPKPVAPPVAAASTKGLVSLTFDDGWDNQYTNAEPIMKAANVSGTFFLITSTLGTKGYMTVAQAKSLQTDGAAEIGSHTVSHRDLTSLDAGTLDAELRNSKSSLEKNFGPITSMAYPFGANDATVQAAAANYYTSARSTAGGNNVRGKYNRYALTIGYVLNTTSLATVQGWIDQAKADNSWLILCYHRVADDQPNNAYTRSVANFRSEINAVKASGLTVVTVRDGIKLTAG